MGVGANLTRTERALLALSFAHITESIEKETLL